MHNELESELSSREQRLTGLQPQLYAPARYATSDADADTLSDYFVIFRRRKLVLLFITILGALAAAGVSLLQRPSYRATASIEVEGVNENFLNLKDVYATTTPAPAAMESPVSTEAESLQEDSLIERVVTKLGLSQHSEFQKSGGFAEKVKEQLGRAEEQRTGQQNYASRALSVVKDHLNVETPHQGRIIRIHYESYDPLLAADVANGLADTLIQQRLEARWGATEQISKWLTPQLDALRRDLAQSEERLQNYAQSQKLYFAGGSENTSELKLRMLQEELAKSQADRILKQSGYETSAEGLPAAASIAAESRVLQENQLKLTELRRQLAELSAVLRPENYKVERVRAQIAELERAQKEEEGRVRDRIQKEFAAATTREQLLNKAYDQQANLVSDQAIKATRYESLKREVEVNRRVYEAMVQKAREAAIASAIQPSNIRMVTAAKPPDRPFKPNLPLNIGIGIFVGMAFGLAYIVASAQTDRKLRKPGQAEVYLNLPELGAIPRAERQLTKPHSGSNGMRVELATRNHRVSAFSESFRTTLASLLYGIGQPPAVFVVTSPLPAEGKTTVASNLGIALAETSRRVLLIDADLRAPQLHKVFAVDNTRGLADLLAGHDSIDEASLRSLARFTGIPNLWVLPSGKTTGKDTSVLHAGQIEQLLSQFRLQFDHVIIDAPPSLLFADARIIARAADGVVLVLRADRTSWPSAVAAAQRLQADGLPILGTVLNDWTPNFDTDAYGYRQLRKYYSRT